MNGRLMNGRGSGEARTDGVVRRVLAAMLSVGVGVVAYAVASERPEAAPEVRAATPNEGAVNVRGWTPRVSPVPRTGPKATDRLNGVDPSDVSRPGVVARARQESAGRADRGGRAFERGPEASSSRPAVRTRALGRTGRASWPPAAIAPDNGGSEPDDPSRAYGPRAQLAAGTDRGRVLRLAQRWQGETFDPTWTETTREYVLETAHAAETDAEAIKDVDCRTTTCRVELLWATPQEANRYAESAYSPDLDYVVQMGQVEDRFQTVVFMARPGEQLETFETAPPEQAPPSDPDPGF